MTGQILWSKVISMLSWPCSTKQMFNLCFPMNKFLPLKCQIISNSFAPFPGPFPPFDHGQFTPKSEVICSNRFQQLLVVCLRSHFKRKDSVIEADYIQTPLSRLICLRRWAAPFRLAKCFVKRSNSSLYS
jgi:hypothetical protein